MESGGLKSVEGRGKPVIACQSLTRVFKDFWMRDRARAVDALSFEVYPREVFGLLGPNGSGKSTTIKVLLGLLRATKGRVAVFGKPPTDVAVKRRIGYLPEESYLYPFLNARETLDYYGKLFEIDPRTRRKRMDELLDMVGLAAAQFRPVREYSKGMQRRIGLAQALINDPDLLILDEPTTGLDPIGTRQVKDLILELRRRGKTVLLSSHLLADVEDCVDRMLILYGGRKRAEGTTDELLVAHHKTTIEAESLDDATISEIDRVIRERSGGGSAVIRVTHPRQRLEELFLDIVESARAERVATSGADQGGTTASFLRGEEDEGEALIDRLTRQEEAEAPGAAETWAERDDGAAMPEEEGGKPDEGLIDTLVSGEEEETDEDKTPASPTSRASPASPASVTASKGSDQKRARDEEAPASDVDRGMIDSLLDQGGDRERDS